MKSLILILLLTANIIADQKYDFTIHVLSKELPVIKGTLKNYKISNYKVPPPYSMPTQMRIEISDKLKLNYGPVKIEELSNKLKNIPKDVTFNFHVFIGTTNSHHIFEVLKILNQNLKINKFYH